MSNDKVNKPMTITEATVHFRDAIVREEQEILTTLTQAIGNKLTKTRVGKVKWSLYMIELHWKALIKLVGKEALHAKS